MGKPKRDWTIFILIVGLLMLIVPIASMHYLSNSKIVLSSKLKDWSDYGSYASFVVTSIIIYFNYVLIRDNKENYELQSKIS
jgi:hypothetical protein